MFFWDTSARKTIIPIWRETVEEILRNNRIEVGTHVKMDMASRFQNGVKVEL